MPDLAHRLLRREACRRVRAHHWQPGATAAGKRGRASGRRSPPARPQMAMAARESATAPTGAGPGKSVPGTLTYRGADWFYEQVFVVGATQRVAAPLVSTVSVQATHPSTSAAFAGRLPRGSPARGRAPSRVTALLGLARDGGGFVAAMPRAGSAGAGCCCPTAPEVVAVGAGSLARDGGSHARAMRQAAGAIDPSHGTPVWAAPVVASGVGADREFDCCAFGSSLPALPGPLPSLHAAVLCTWVDGVTRPAVGTSRLLAAGGRELCDKCPV